MTSKKQVSGWAHILDDILINIADKLQCLQDPIRKDSLKDRIRMSMVCRSWYASLKYEKFTKKFTFPVFPVCLMTAEKTKSYKRSFYDTSEKVFIELELPEIQTRKCWGSPFGWLVTYGLDGEIQLFNPLSRTYLPLPPQSTFTHQKEGRSAQDLRDYFITKLLLCSNPASPDCIVMAIYSEYYLLGFAKPGDQTWTAIPGTQRTIGNPLGGPVDDVIYFNGNFFAVLQSGTVFICEDLDGTDPRAILFASKPAQLGPHRAYIFECGGNLCLANHFPLAAQNPIRRRLQFEIFKLDLQTRIWEKIYSLGDRSLFLGECYSFSVVATDYKNCQANCIYFADDSYIIDYSDGSDFGIFDCEFLQNYKYEPDPFIWEKNMQDKEEFRSSFSPPLWLIPYPC